MACAATEDGAAERARAESGPELAATTLALHEVAFLYPLPANGDGLIAATHELEPGRALLPMTMVEKLGSIVAGEPNDITHASLRVVGVRLEPCFRASHDSSCERQLRFVLQPVSVDPSGALPTTTLDAAVHVIYRTSREAFAELVHAIVAARPADVIATGPLDVHPVLAREGAGGPYARALETAFTRAARRGALARVTFLGLRGRGNEWQLGGVDVASDGSTKPLTIATSDARIQSFVLQRGSESFSKSIVPKVDDDLVPLLDSANAIAAPREDITRALRAANQIENPTLRSSEDTGCATCHTIASSRLWAETKLGVRDDRDRFMAEGFDLSARSRPLGDPGALRALGYFGTDPVVSPRAIHDTALAARWIAGDRMKP